MAFQENNAPEFKKMNSPNSVQIRPPSLGRKFGLGFVFLWFSIGGIAHFVATGLEMRIVPPWLPQHRLLVLVSGVFELLGAFGLLLPITRRVAGWGLMLLTIAVTPANVYMLQEASQYPAIPYWALVIRLPLQLALLVCIWWSTQPEKTPGFDSTKRRTQ